MSPDKTRHLAFAEDHLVLGAASFAIA